MALNYVTLTLDLYDGQGNPVTKGTASFTPSAQLTDAGVELVPQVPIPAVFHAAGTPAVKLLATDNAAVLPAGWVWTVLFSGVPGNPAAFSFSLPFASGASQFLSSQVPVSAPSAFLGSTAAGVSVYPSGDTSGVTDQAVITAAEALGRTVSFAAGTFWVTGLAKQSFTYWRGAGVGATFLKLAAGANTDVVQGAGFTGLTLTGASGWGSSGIWDWGISGMTIDGNASAQSGTSYGLRAYGYQWTLADLDVRNCLTDGIWTEWGSLSSNAPVTSDGSEATARNVRCTYNGRHGWSHLGPSDARMTNVLTYLNNQAGTASGIGLWALLDQISNVCSTASGMNGTSATGFTGTFTVQAAALGGATDLYAPTGTLKVTTSSGTATMTYTGKTATTFTGCTVTSGAGTFQTGNAVTTSAAKFTSNGLQTVACHSWGNTQTWMAVFDGQVSDSGSHWEGGQYGQVLVRSSTNMAGGSVYDISTIETGCGIQLGDAGATGGVPLSASIKANACSIATRAYSFLNDTAARSSLNWVSASQSSVDLLSVTRQSGTFATTIASGSNGVDLSTFTGGSPGTLSVASTQAIPNGPGSLTIATAQGNQTATYTGTNGSNGPARSAGTQFTGVVAVGAPGSSTMSTGGAVSLQNLGSLAVGGTVDANCRIRVETLSSTVALSTGASQVQETGKHTIDVGSGANAFRLKGISTDYDNLNTSSNPVQRQFPNGVVSRWYSDNYSTKVAEISGTTGAAQLASLALTGSPLPLGSGGTGLAAVTNAGLLTSLGAAALQAASASFKPSNPTGTASGSLVCMGIGSTCVLTPSGTGKVLVTVCGIWNTATASVQGNIGARYGTSTAPVNGAAVTGTRFGSNASDPVIKAISLTAGVPFAFTEIVTLTPATAYWFDLVTSTSVGADVASITNIVMTLAELAQ